MTILGEVSRHRRRLRLVNAWSLASEQLLCLHSVNADLRWAMLDLAVRSLAAIWLFAQARLVALVRRMVRDEKEPCTPGVTAADTMVAAGRR
jgi:hypothetical protein